MFVYVGNCSSNARQVRYDVCVIFSQPDDLNLHSRSQLRLKLDKCLTCAIIVMYRTLLL